MIDVLTSSWNGGHSVKPNIAFEKQYVFEEGQPFRSSHASTVAVLPNGDVLAAWFAGAYEKSSDVAIWMSRREGGAWSAPCKVADEEGIAHWNPVLYARDDSLILFYKVGHEITDWFTRSIRSEDGHTWCTAYPTSLPNNNSGIAVALLANGALALVFNPVSGFATDSPRTPLVIRFSNDNGRTWGDEFVLEDEPGEYSYPAIVSRGNELYVTYTWKRERIAFWKLTATM